jgi:hypothetical protein
VTSHTQTGLVGLKRPFYGTQSKVKTLRGRRSCGSLCNALLGVICLALTVRPPREKRVSQIPSRVTFSISRLKRFPSHQHRSFRTDNLRGTSLPESDRQWHYLRLTEPTCMPKVSNITQDLTHGLISFDISVCDPTINSLEELLDHHPFTEA